METCAKRPYEDGPQISFLRAHPIDKLTSEKAEHSIENREDRCDCAVVGISPVELGRNEVFPSKGKHLAVHIVDRRGKKQHSANHPTIVGHFSRLNWAHFLFNHLCQLVY